MSTKRIVAVFGATGNQGKSVVYSLLEHGFSVRATTRNQNSEFSLALKAKGAEIFQADLKNIEEVKNVLHGAYAVFANLVVPPGEQERVGKMWADVAVEENIQHYIWSGACNSDKISGGKYSIPFYMTKVRVLDYMKEKKLPYTELLLSEFMQNYLSFAPQCVEGIYEFRGPRRPSYETTLVDVDLTTGPAVCNILANREQYLEKTVIIKCEKMTLEKMAEIYSKVTGRKARYVQMSDEEFLSSNSAPWFKFLLNMYKFFDEFGSSFELDPLVGKITLPNIPTWEQFVKNHLAEFLGK